MNRTERFVDTGYLIAVTNRRDSLHPHALRLAASVAGPFVTTELVLVELFDAFSGTAFRNQALRVLQHIRESGAYEIIPTTADLFQRGVERFAARPDKEWGLTDCISFVVMEQRGISEALAADRHFTQAGFRALLLG